MEGEAPKGPWSEVPTGSETWLVLGVSASVIKDADMDSNSKRARVVKENVELKEGVDETSVDEKDVDAAVEDGLVVLKLELDTLLAEAEIDESKAVELLDGNCVLGAALLLTKEDETKAPLAGLLA